VQGLLFRPSQTVTNLIYSGVYVIDMAQVQGNKG